MRLWSKICFLSFIFHSYSKASRRFHAQKYLFKTTGPCNTTYWPKRLSKGRTSARFCRFSARKRALSDCLSSRTWRTTLKKILYGTRTLYVSSYGRRNKKKSNDIGLLLANSKTNFCSHIERCCHLHFNVVY